MHNQNQEEQRMWDAVFAAACAHESVTQAARKADHAIFWLRDQRWPGSEGARFSEPASASAAPAPAAAPAPPAVPSAPYFVWAKGAMRSAVAFVRGFGRAKGKAEPVAAPSSPAPARRDASSRPWEVRSVGGGAVAEPGFRPWQPKSEQGNAPFNLEKDEKSWAQDRRPESLLSDDSPFNVPYGTARAVGDGTG